jgi:hypothetical protein
MHADAQDDWCQLTWPRSKGTLRAAPLVLLATSLFYFPNYTKTYTGNRVVDETHTKQGAFLAALRHYADLFDGVAWMRSNVRLRVYHDDSLLAYRDAAGRAVWAEELAAGGRLGGHPSFEWVRFRFARPHFREHLGPVLGDGHRGLLGTITRFHALHDFEQNRGAGCVCLIDADGLYTRRWWDAHLAFLERARGKVMAVVGPFETPLYGHLVDAPAPGEYRPMLHAGMLTLAGDALLPSAQWRDLSRAIDTPAERAYLALLDAMRCSLYGSEQVANDRLFSDFAYGFDEALLNRIVLPPAALARLGLVEINTLRGVAPAARFFADKLMRFLRWNGERSVALRQLACAMRLSDAPTIEGARLLLERCAAALDGAAMLRLRDWGEFERRVLAPLRPHLALLEQLQLDHRLLQVFHTPLAVTPFERSSDYHVGLGRGRDADAAALAANTREMTAARWSTQGARRSAARPTQGGARPPGPRGAARGRGTARRAVRPASPRRAGREKGNA